jgi:hypothetical protein
MISTVIPGVDAMPTQRADRFRMPVGTRVRSVASLAEVYVQGRAVFAAWAPAPTSARTNAPTLPGPRIWSPPV